MAPVTYPERGQSTRLRPHAGPYSTGPSFPRRYLMPALQARGAISQTHPLRASGFRTLARRRRPEEGRLTLDDHPRDQFCGITDAEFLHDRAAMDLDGARRDAERLGDFLAGVAVDDIARHLTLLCGQHRRTRRTVPQMLECPDHQVERVGGRQRATARPCPDDLTTPALHEAFVLIARTAFQPAVPATACLFVVDAGGIQHPNRLSFQIDAVPAENLLDLGIHPQDTPVRQDHDADGRIHEAGEIEQLLRQCRIVLQGGLLPCCVRFYVTST